MVDRIRETRVLFREALEEAGAAGNWSHITSQKGMYSFTGLTGSTHLIENLIQC